MCKQNHGFTRGELIHSGKANDVYAVPEDQFLL